MPNGVIDVSGPNEVFDDSSQCLFVIDPFVLICRKETNIVRSLMRIIIQIQRLHDSHSVSREFYMTCFSNLSGCSVGWLSL